MTTATLQFHRPDHLAGEVRVPGDKSISHRALLLAGLATGQSVLHGLATGDDVAATAACLRQLGVDVAVQEAAVVVTSPGHAHWHTPQAPLDCGNSGTTMRLLLGLLAAKPGLRAVLTGDASLSRRPMARVADPLRALGADIALVDGHAPVTVVGQALRGTSITLSVASAQVKSAVLLAGLFASGQTQVTEPLPSRDHTERMLPALGMAVTSQGLTHAVMGEPHRTIAASPAWQIPGDPSSSAFPIVAALLHPDADVAVPGVSLNPTRLGYLRVLERMRAQVGVVPGPTLGDEPTGTLHAQTSDLYATDVTAAEVPSLIDEVPILALAAAAAHGTTRFAGVGELRVKESDRLTHITRLLAALGVAHRSGEDWLEVDGQGGTGPWHALQAPWVPGLDHRLAMTAAVAGLVGPHPVAVAAFQAAAASSWPEFTRIVEMLGAGRA